MKHLSNNDNIKTKKNSTNITSARAKMKMTKQFIT